MLPERNSFHMLPYMYVVQLDSYLAHLGAILQECL